MRRYFPLLILFTTAILISSLTIMMVYPTQNGLYYENPRADHILIYDYPYGSISNSKDVYGEISFDPKINRLNVSISAEFLLPANITESSASIFVQSARSHDTSEFTDFDHFSFNQLSQGDQLNTYELYIHLSTIVSSNIVDTIHIRLNLDLLTDQSLPPIEVSLLNSINVAAYMTFQFIFMFSTILSIVLIGIVYGQSKQFSPLAIIQSFVLLSHGLTGVFIVWLGELTEIFHQYNFGMLVIPFLILLSPFIIDLRLAQPLIKRISHKSEKLDNNNDYDNDYGSDIDLIAKRILRDKLVPLLAKRSLFTIVLIVLVTTFSNGSSFLAGTAVQMLLLGMYKSISSIKL